MQGTNPTIRRIDYQAADFLVEQVELWFDLDPDKTVVRSRIDFRRNPLRPGMSLRLDGQRLELLEVRLNGNRLEPDDYRLDKESLLLSPVPEQFTLEVTTRINPAANTELEGLYQSNGIFCTQCEAEGFRRITYYPDRPDVLAPFRTTVTAPQGIPYLLANGNRVDAGELPDGRHFVTWEDPFPKPCYLFALVAGDLAEISDSFVTASGRDVALRFYVEPHHRDKVEHAVRALKKAMRWDEERFGREYDLDIYMVVAVDDFNMGAMENKGLNIFNSKYVLARPDTATDADYQAIEEVIAHEYFHNWTGNRVTCRDWFQLSLKEGLTVFRDQEFSADQVHRAVKRIEDVRLLRNNQFPEDAGPMAHPVRPESYQTINNFYTMTVYHKGAEVIRMYQALLGRERFRAGMDLYFERFDGQAVTCDDFLAVMAEAGGRDLSLFSNWYSQAGTPQLQMEGEYADGEFRLRVRQRTPETPGQTAKRPVHLPLRMALLDSRGTALPLRLAGEAVAGGTERVLEVTESEQVFWFVGLTEFPVPSLLRGFSAPVRYSFPYRQDELLFLFRHDSDPFARWEAGQSLFSRTLLAMVTAVQQGEPVEVAPELSDACEAILLEEKLDAGLCAQLLMLPSEGYLADQMVVADPDAIRQARQQLRLILATRSCRVLSARYRELASTDGYHYDSIAAGRRELKNLCLGYLAVAEGGDGVSTCGEQFATADNMTDSLAALRVLVDSNAPQRHEMLQAFFERWQHEPLVVDKWFSLQATSTRSDTLDQVRRLLQHPVYTMKNPNRVRSLLGAFAHTNQAAFHDRDGNGYRLIAEQTVLLDKLNPQLAARLVSAFNRRRQFDKARQGLMLTELQKIRIAPGLSRDVAEIVEKNLDSQG
ncbi:MAG: aminopeptidase N [Desulfuromonas sp.]|nr:MAG: aminopeptidase N [Desulfuromonas sp.]